jgi:7 transmembrane sweet-taste receptor of 3 GCPR
MSPSFYSLINLGLFCATVFQSCKSRNLSTEYQESQYIFRALIGILLVAFIGVPVLIIARDNTNSRLFVTSGIIFVMCLLILLLIFVPKIHFERSPHNAERPEVSHISGLDMGLTCTGGLNTGFGSTSDSVHFTRPSEVFSIEDESESGEQIFSSKTQTELVKEVTALKRYIRLLTTRLETQETVHSSKITNEEYETTEMLGRQPVVHFADPDEDHDDCGNSSTLRLSDDELLFPSEVGRIASTGHGQEETSPYEEEGPDATYTQHQDPESYPLSEKQP